MGYHVLYPYLFTLRGNIVICYARYPKNSFLHCFVVFISFATILVATTCIQSDINRSFQLLQPPTTTTLLHQRSNQKTMELLPEGQRNTATEVSWDDQQKINKFSTLIGKKDEATVELSKLNQEKEYLDDLLLELELLDEDEKVQYKIGEVFVALKQEAALARLEKSNTDLEVKIDKINSTIAEYDEKLDTLKSQLYEKFGSNINLER